MNKQIVYLVITSFLVFQFFFFNSCTEKSTIIEPITERFGLTGRIIDTSGVPIQGAGVYCIFNEYSIPTELEENISVLNKLNDKSDFDFELFNNFPNPFSNSTFIRFSIPEECIVKIKIKLKGSSSPVILYQETLAYGFYQYFADKAIERLNLLNGIYVYSLEAKGISGQNYNTEKEFFIVSDMGKPNSVSSSEGNYFLNYEHTFINDSVRVQYDANDDFAYKKNIWSTINVLVEKDGYQSKMIQTELYPNVMISRDIVLERGENE